MSLSVKEASIGNKKLNAEATLNPNAAEFVPFSLRSQAESIKIPDASSKFSISGKSILNRSESSASNNSNSEEVSQRYWCQQLPDDINPDFKVMGMDNEINSLSFSHLTLNEVNRASRYTSPKNSDFMLKEHQAFSLHPIDGNNNAEKMRYPLSSYGECFQTSPGKPRVKQIGSSDQLLAREKNLYNGNSSRTLLSDMLNEQLLSKNTDMRHLEFLASQFPDFASESIAEVYFSNGWDLNLTIKRLTQLEIQVGGGLNQTLSPKSFSTLNHCASGVLNLPALHVPDGCHGLGKFSGNNQHNVSPYRSSLKDALPFRSFSSIPSRVTTDFASAARKTASQDSSIWKYDSNWSSDTKKFLASSYNSDHMKYIYGDRLQTRGSPLASPLRLGTGESVGNIFESVNLICSVELCRWGKALCVYMYFNLVDFVANFYSEKCEEAPDHARGHNSYIDQARQAYLASNKTLSKELSILGQLHNLQMKAAHRRNSDIQTNGRENMIYLDGLNVSEAMFVLKRELAVLRNAARSVDQRFLAYIFVGASHLMRGSPTPARHLSVVQLYLLEEGLDYSELQPGLLRVMIY